MDEKPYENREIREMFTSVQETLGRIETQTTKTNGRVTDLERSVGHLYQWRAYILGSVATLSFIIIAVAIPIIIELIKIGGI
jgi:hypothetical protein